MPLAFGIRALRGAETATSLDVALTFVAHRTPNANARAALTRGGVSRGTMTARPHVSAPVHRVQAVRAPHGLAGAACRRGVEAAGGGGPVAGGGTGAEEGHEAEEGPQCAQ